MKRPSFPSRSRRSTDIDSLMHLAQALARSTGYLEDRYWEEHMTQIIMKLLQEEDEDTLMTALDNLFAMDVAIYDGLADRIEACCETRHIPNKGVGFDVQLFVAPVLAWSRLKIPCGPIATVAMERIRKELNTHVLATDAQLGLANYLYSPDQLPRRYTEVSQFMDKLTHAALHNRDVHFDGTQFQQTASFLSDTRYIVGAIAVPKGGALFRWQEESANLEMYVRNWREHGGEALRSLLPACAMEALTPGAFHFVLREADRAARPYSLRAAVSFLQTTLNISSHMLRIVVAPFYDHQIEEYRASFALPDAPEIVHGVVWPLLESEDEAAEAPWQIEQVLREAGLVDITFLEDRFPLEFCDDCGAPLYPNHEGEPVHAELPELKIQQVPRHLH